MGLFERIVRGQGTHHFLSLLKSIGAAKLEEGVSMKDYIRGVRQAAEQLSEMGLKLEKVAVVGFILNGLPEGYHYLVVNLESQVKAISYEDLSARLMDKEKRLMPKGHEDLELADPDTVTANLARSNGRGIFPGRGFDKEPRICHKCGQPGHVKWNCPEILKDIECRWCGVKGHREATCDVKKFQAKRGLPTDDCRAYSAVFGG